MIGACCEAYPATLLRVLGLVERRLGPEPALSLLKMLWVWKEISMGVSR